MKLCTAQSCLEMAPALSVHWLMFAPATLPLSIRICWLLVLDGLLGGKTNAQHPPSQCQTHPPAMAHQAAAAAAPHQAVAAVPHLAAAEAPAYMKRLISNNGLSENRDSNP